MSFLSTIYLHITLRSCSLVAFLLSSFFSLVSPLFTFTLLFIDEPPSDELFPDLLPLENSLFDLDEDLVPDLSDALVSVDGLVRELCLALDDERR